MNCRRYLVAPLLLALIVAPGCEQFRSLKPSNSEEQPREPGDDEVTDKPRDASVPATPRDASIPFGSTFSCSAPRLLCNSVCVDVSTSSIHCGMCGNGCNSFQRCADGACVCSSGSQVQCEGKCVWPMLGVCGECGKAESCLSEPACEDGQSHAADWPTLAGDLGRTGYNAGERGVPPLTKAWALSLASSPLSAVMVGGSRVFVAKRSSSGTASSSLAALDVATGAQVWSKDFGVVGSVGVPALAGCRVYVEHGSGPGSSVGRLWSLSAATGEAVWGRASSSSTISSEGPLVTGTTVYAAISDFRGPYAVARPNGALVFEPGTSSFSSFATASFYDGELYTYLDGALQRRDPSTFQLRDSIGASTDYRVRPAIGADGVAYLVGSSSLYAFEIKTKKLLWQVAAKPSTSPAVAEGKVVLIDDGVLTARDAKTGTLLWTASATKGLVQVPVAAHGFAYVTSASDTYAVDLATGAVVWQELGAGTLAIGGGHLLVAGTDGILRSYTLTQPSSP